MAAAGLALLIGAAFYSSFYRPHAQVSADVVATAVKFEYHPPPAEPAGGPEVPLLAGATLEELGVRSFETLTVSSGTVSVRDSDDQPWSVVQPTGPIVIGGDSPSAQAIFPRVAIERWAFASNPTISLEFPGGQPVLRALIEGKGIDLFFDAGESVEFECQSCRIGALEVAPMRQVKLSELNNVALKASSQSTMVLNVTSGLGEVKGQRFRLSHVRFCGGKGRVPESTLVSGSVTFRDTGDVHSLDGQAGVDNPAGFLRVTAEEAFSATALRAVDVNGLSALGLTFDGLAHRAEMSEACDASGEQFQPSLFNVLSHRPVVVATSAAFAILFGWLALFDQLKGLWGRLFGKEADK